MARRLCEIEKEVMQLSARERAELAHDLIASLEPESDAGAEGAWLQEAERRYEQYCRGCQATRKVDPLATPETDPLGRAVLPVDGWFEQSGLALGLEPVTVAADRDYLAVVK
jgi:hypothetical protein